MIKPLNNNVLVEIIDEYDGIIRDAANEQVQKGVVVSFALSPMHLTASAAFDISGNNGAVNQAALIESLDELVGKTVYWEEYSDTGKKFEQDGKRYSLIPFYRLIGFEG